MSVGCAIIYTFPALARLLIPRIWIRQICITRQGAWIFDFLGGWGGRKRAEETSYAWLVDSPTAGWDFQSVLKLFKSCKDLGTLYSVYTWYCSFYLTWHVLHNVLCILKCRLESEFEGFLSWVRFGSVDDTQSRWTTCEWGLLAVSRFGEGNVMGGREMGRLWRLLGRCWDPTKVLSLQDGQSGTPHCIRPIS